MSVALADLEAQVEDQPLADLALRVAHAVMRVERQPGDLDRHLGLRAVLVPVLVVVLVLLVGEVVLAVRGHRRAT
jgi:hypothetical protein